MSISRWNCLFKGFGWEVGTLVSLFLISAVLGLFGSKLVLTHASFLDILRVLLVAAWFYIVGLVSLAVISLSLFVRAMTRCREEVIL